MIVGLLQLAAFLGTAWLIGHAVDLWYGRAARPRPRGGTPPRRTPVPHAPGPRTPEPRVPEVAGHR